MLGPQLAPRNLATVLTSIHWREAWKYGERAFRYCQHDLGHAIATISLAASMLGWRTELGAASAEAKALQRPILLWAMNGHPCGLT